MKKNLAVSVKMLVDTFHVCSMESMLKKTFDLDANEIESPKKLVVNSAEVLGRGFEHIVSGFLH